MARTANRRQREASRARARAAADARQAATRRRQRIIAAVVAGLVVLSLVGAVVGSRTTSSSTPTTTAPPASSTSTTSLPQGGIAPVAVPMGDALDGPTPCPAEDGSSPRVTLFAEAPPTCIDPTYFYVATLHTTAGDLTVQLNPGRAPGTVNDFVVLARYHFYDGQPVATVQSRASFTVGVELSGDGADQAPGFEIASEAPPGGVVFVPGMLAMVPAPGSTASRGQLLVATFEDAAGIDPGVTAFGTMLSGDGVLSAVDALATESGLPAEAVTVTSIDVVRSSAIPA